MIVILTFLSVLLALMYYALIGQVYFEALGAEFFASLVIFFLGIGGMILKFARYKYEHMSQWRYLSGFIVFVILIGSGFDYVGLWHEATTFWRQAYLVWMGFLAIFIFSLPIWDITYSRDEEHAEV